MRINEKPTYQKSKAELLKKMQELPVNFEACAPREKEVLKIAYIKGEEFNEQKHLLKSPPPVATKFVAFCTRCSPAMHSF